MKLAFLLVLLFSFPSLTHAQSSSQVVTVTTGVNICGNGIIETPAEDCEGLDVNGKNCTTLGYSSGTLNCDIACSFVTTDCVVASPSTSLPPTTPAPSGIPSSPQDEVGSPTPAPSEVPTLPRDEVVSLPAPIIALISTLGLERLTLPNLRPVIQSWVDSWRATNTPLILAKCDINIDATCDLTDLSIIFYHVRP